jgi:hypothetical protein
MSWDRDDLRRELSKLGVKPHEMFQLLHSDRRPISKGSNISIGFTPLDEWLNDLDEPQQRPLRKALGKYRIEQASYRRHVAEQLALLQRKKTGRAVLAEVKAAAPLKLAIQPFRPSVDNEINADAFGFSSVHSTMAGLWVRDAEGHIVHDSETGERILGLGGGSPAIIDYSPEMWGKSGSAHVSGPGSQPDEVLCHELVHAAREMKGVQSMRAVGDNDVDLLYENEEEFVAIVITNIYLSEKKQTKLRGTHHADVTRDHGKVTSVKMDRLADPRHFLGNSQGTTLPPTELMEKIRYRQRALWDALVKIGPSEAAFNPVRDWEPQRMRGRIDI